ncbi:MAG: hypothetical protein WC306_03210 [Candidatus Paceibacterota bacterium]
MKISLSRKRIILLSVTVFLLIGLITYSTHSFLTWRSYKGQFTDLSKIWVEKLDKVLLSVSSDNDSQVEINSFKKYIEEFKKSELCKISPLIAWQQIIPAAKLIVEQCQSKIVVINDLVDKLNDIVAYLENEYALSDIFKNVVSLKNESKEADWENSVSTWKTAHANVESLIVIDEFTEIKQAAQETTGNIYIAWQELLDSHKAGEQARFIKARSELMLNYDKLTVVKTISENQLDKLISDLEVTYKKTK